MAENEVAITYETIFEILRREKNREELQKLDNRFYSQVFDYIASLKAEIKTLSSNPEQESDAEKLRIQLGNIRRIIAEIYNRRERKIIGIAVIKSRTRDSIISTSALLDRERELFNSLCDTLLLQRKVNFSDFEKGFEKMIDLARAGETEKKNFTADSLKNKEEKAEEEKNKEETEDKVEKQHEPGSNEITPLIAAGPEISSFIQHVSKVKITETLPKFVGPNLEIYGPYNPGEVTEVPQMIAKILIDQGKAQAE